MKITRFFLILFVLLGSCPLPGFAKDSIAYNYFILSRFPNVQLAIPKNKGSDRFFVRSNLKQRIVKAQVAIDNQQLISALGNKSSLFLPEELIQGFHQSVTDVNAFPSQLVSQAKSQIRLSFYLENGKEKILTIRGRQLKQILMSLSHSIETK